MISLLALFNKFPLLLVPLSILVMMSSPLVCRGAQFITATCGFYVQGFLTTKHPRFTVYCITLASFDGKKPSAWQVLLKRICCCQLNRNPEEVVGIGSGTQRTINSMIFLMFLLHQSCLVTLFL